MLQSQLLPLRSWSGLRSRKTQRRKKTELNTAIEKLNRIPRWSSYHQESTQLISQYQQIVQDLNYFIEANKLVKNADNMSKQLPLSADEWKRVKKFLQDAIAQVMT